MGTNISLFPTYSTKENRVTNYALLVLRQIYEENPKFLGEVLSELCSGEVGPDLGVSFWQQTKSGESIADGRILQKGIEILIEVKNYDWFYDDQIYAYLNALSSSARSTKVLLILSNFEEEIEGRFKEISATIKDKYENSIVFAPQTFQNFLAALKNLDLEKNLADMVLEFEDFLNENNLLPSWENWLDVVNCAGLPEDLLDANVYLCPAAGGAYSHGRCKYFGMYRNKTVEYVALIRAVVDISGDNEDYLKWNNGKANNETLIAEARAVALERRPDDLPVRVFLLGELFPTDFRKDSHGGLLGSKIYFDISALDIANANELSRKISGLVWSDLRS